MQIATHRKPAEALIDVVARRAAADRGGRSHQEDEKIRVAVAHRALGLLDTWEGLMKTANEGGADRCYSPWDPGKKGKPLLMQLADVDEDTSDEQRAFCAPSSMRDVEGSVHLWVKRGPLGGRRPG